MCVHAQDAKSSWSNSSLELDKVSCSAIIETSQLQHDGAGAMLDRRSFIASGGVLALTQAEALAAPAADPNAKAGAPATSDVAPEPLYALTPDEADVLTAIVDAFIPADELTPSGSDCGVVVFIDRQLAGAYGAGARLYQDGPFQPGSPLFGPQSPLAPLQFVQLGIAELDAWSAAERGARISRLPKPALDALLKEMEAGKVALPRIDARALFGALLQLTMEGFFSDPIYGGNRNKASWRMLGYPGLPATYAKLIKDYRGRRYEAEPKSIADFL
jgi:gluconate 2-dehydrogenase gamma chain